MCKFFYSDSAIKYTQNKIPVQGNLALKKKVSLLHFQQVFCRQNIFLLHEEVIIYSFKKCTLMKNFIKAKHHFVPVILVFLTLLIVSAGCKKYDASPSIQSQTSSDISLNGYKIVKLVADKDEFHALRVDHNLHNAWGMSSDDEEAEIWVSAADGGVSFVYDQTGKHIMPPVIIPSHEKGARGNPTGNVYNNTDEDFVIPGTGEPAEFIFASEDGTVSAWNDPAGGTAILVADRSGHDASYKGIAIAKDGGENFLYVTNFSQKKIDVFDKNFQHVTGKQFKDPNIPDTYAPFGIRNLHNMLYVTYARQTADGEEDSAGVGLGFVDVFHPDGSLATRFAAHGTLNAPWGIAEAKPGLCDNDNNILIGNFGDGRINVFDLNGKFKGQLMNGGDPIAIEGLWAIDNNIPDISPKQLYFTAGPNDEEDGLFGYLEKK